MKKAIKGLIALTTIMVLLVTSAVYAKTDNPNAKGQENQYTKRYERQLKNFDVIDGNRIKVRGKHVKFDTPPVIKAGRTLIPVRAITEAMGGLVEWNADDMIATIISPSGLIRIDFYLMDVDLNDDDLVDVLGGTIIIFDKSDDSWIQREELVKTDVLPGLINNRTFVPLRFISEVFGLKVGYDAGTGEIDIDDPDVKIDPEAVTYSLETLIPAETLISVILDDYEFDSIVGLVKDTDYKVTTAVVTDYTTEPSLFIHIYESYVESLTAAETELEIKFIKGRDELSEIFTINLDDHLLAEISPEAFVFKGQDLLITLIPHDYEFEIVRVDGATAQFTGPVDNKITLQGSYLSYLLDGKDTVTLEFEFTKDSEVQTVDLLVTAYEYDPKISPESVTYLDVEDMDDPMTIEVMTDGYELDSIVGLALTDYISRSVVVTDITTEPSLFVDINKAYVNGLTEEVTELTLNFKKGTEVASKTFTIILDYNHLLPSITTGPVTYTGTDIVIDVELHDYTLESVKAGVTETVVLYDDSVVGKITFLASEIDKLIDPEAEATLEFTFAIEGRDDVVLTVTVNDEVVEP